MIRLLVFASLLLRIYNTQAQTDFGIKAGVNLAMIPDGSSTSKELYGLNAGLYFRGTDPLTVQVEMLYSGQGGSFYDVVTGQTTDRRLHYLNGTLLLRYMPTETVGLVVGPQFGILLYAKEGDVNISSQYNPMDLGINVGTDYDVGHAVTCSFRYFHSLRSVKNQVFQISVGYRIQRRR